MEYKWDCLWFSGYKPCKFKRTCEACPYYTRPEKRIAIVSLEAMGAVLRSTCLLPPLLRKYPSAHVTWITLPMNESLLRHNPFIHKIFFIEPKSVFALLKLKFDILYVVDKSTEAGGVAELVQADEKFGFGLTELGAIRPLSPQADYQFALGLDDQLKFFKNQKPETQQITETMGLEWKRDEYILELEEKEKIESLNRKISLSSVVDKKVDGIIGYNTGCSPLYSYKKFTIDQATHMIKMWRVKFPSYVVALLGGGPEDKARQVLMKERFSDDPMVVSTPTDEGMRSGLIWVDACDLIFSGCSLGMHMGIALKKPMIAWFGVSCSQEVDLYDRGVKLVAEVSCTPCWRRSCENTPKCYDSVSVSRIEEATKKLLNQLQPLST